MKTGLLPYMLKSPDEVTDVNSSHELPPSHETAIGKELSKILQGRMLNLRDAADELGRLIGPVDEITTAVVSSQAVLDRLAFTG